MTPNRLHELADLYKTLKDITNRHPGLASFETGDITEFNANNHTFPLLYLETISSFNEEDRTERYSIVVNVCDREADKTKLVTAYSKLKQTFSSFKRCLEEHYGEKRIGAASGQLFKEFGTQDLVVLRAEFTITVNRWVNPGDNKTILA